MSVSSFIFHLSLCFYLKNLRMYGIIPDMMKYTKNITATYNLLEIIKVPFSFVPCSFVDLCMSVAISSLSESSSCPQFTLIVQQFADYVQL